MSNPTVVPRLPPSVRDKANNTIGNNNNDNSVATKAQDLKVSRKNADKNSWMLTALIVTTSISLAMLITIIIVIAIDPFPLAKSWSIGINILTYGKSKGKNSIQDDQAAIVRIFPGSTTIQKASQNLRNEALRALVDYYSVRTSSTASGITVGGSITRTTRPERSNESDLSVPSHLVWHVRRYYKDVDKDTILARKRQKRNSLSEENSDNPDPRLIFLKSLIDKLDYPEEETRHGDKSTLNNNDRGKFSKPTGERIPIGKRSAIYISQRIVGCRIEILPPTFRSYYRSSYAGLVHYCLPLLIPSRDVGNTNKHRSDRSDNNNETSNHTGHCIVRTQKKSYEINENRAFVFDSSHSQWDLENSHERLPCILLWIDVARPLPGILAMTNRFLTKNLSRSRLADVYFGERKPVASVASSSSSSGTKLPLPINNSFRKNKRKSVLSRTKQKDQ